jgi:hypothetical protein
VSFELCFVCGAETGRAGAGDDSIYVGENVIGPWCEDCYDSVRREIMEEAALLADAPAPVADAERALAKLGAAVIRDHLSPTGGFTHARFEALDRAGMVAGVIVPGGETGPVLAPGIAEALDRLLAPDGAVTDG